MTPAEEMACRVLKLSPGDEVPERRWRVAVDIAECVLAAFQAESLPTQTRASQTTQSPRTIAKLKGYTGDTCQDCGNLSMVRNGTCLKCDTCGSTSGCS